MEPLLPYLHPPQGPYLSKLIGLANIIERRKVALSVIMDLRVKLPPARV